ncbi:hypothetical protein MNBD_ACTINO02-3029 [hydrothermal vent metagenome]|uniref:Uncharacterized protein n=1 Tax=hydrothermal vent metagenome TaxID=652676 RepID=A0A3B0RLV5_9ZZZZ
MLPILASICPVWNTNGCPSRGRGRLCAGRTVTTVTTRCIRKVFDRNDLLGDVWHDDELCNSLAAYNVEWLCAVVDQRNLDFPTVSRIDQPGAVHDADPMLEGESAAWHHERTVLLRDLECDSRGDENSLPGTQSSGDHRPKINTRITGMAVRWQRKLGIETKNGYLHSFTHYDFCEPQEQLG